MAGGDVTLEIKKLTLHELMATQLELMATEQAKQRDVIEDIRRQLDPLRELPALVRTVLENQARR
jgi:hypothetical protein